MLIGRTIPVVYSSLYWLVWNFAISGDFYK